MDLDDSVPVLDRVSAGGSKGKASGVVALPNLDTTACFNSRDDEIDLLSMISERLRFFKIGFLLCRAISALDIRRPLLFSEQDSPKALGPGVKGP